MENALPCPDLLRERDSLLARLHEISAQRTALREKQAGLAERRDLLEMQQQEIDKVSPEEGEEDQLEELRAKSRSLEHLRENYDMRWSCCTGATMRACSIFWALENSSMQGAL